MSEKEEWATEFVKSDLYRDKKGFQVLIKALNSKGLSGIDDVDSGLQGVHTPFDLCEEIITQLDSRTDLKSSDILVLFNLEFVDVLIREFGVSAKNITFVADSDVEEQAAIHWLGITEIHRVSYDGKEKKGERIKIMPNIKKQFDVVLMNPPYQAPSETRKGTTGGSIWDKFVELSLTLCKENGFVANIHPASWRKPGHHLFLTLSELDIQYLELHSRKDGVAKFGAQTNYDWYVLRNAPSTQKTEIVDYKGNNRICNLGIVPFVPNWNEKDIYSILAQDGEEKCEVLYSTSLYETRKIWMSKEKDEKFKHPCVHSMTKRDGIGFLYSSKKEKFFGEPKIILSVSENQYPYNDSEGNYGLTQNIFALKIYSHEEGELMVKAINSDRFKEIIASTKWGTFLTDWRMFTYFRKDFWKEFI